MNSMPMNDQTRSAAHNMALKEDHTVPAPGGLADTDSYNLNSSHFNPDMFLHQLIKDATLPQLMDTESRVYSQIQALDSEMQTLVYENYNKFIAATDTIRKMKQDFRCMEDEMERLSANMVHIAAFSGTVADTLQDRRDEISRLSSTHEMLQKLQFLFELPAQLNDAIQKENFQQAVEYEQQWRRVWQQQQREGGAVPAAGLASLSAECDASVDRLVATLHSRLMQPQAGCEQVSACARLLLRLRQPAGPLAERVLLQAAAQLAADLAPLTEQAQQAEALPPDGDASAAAAAAAPNATTIAASPADLPKQPLQDVLQFVDVGCSNFLSNLSLVVTSFRELFLKQRTDGAESDTPPSAGAGGRASPQSTEPVAAAERLAEFTATQWALLVAGAQRRLLAEPAGTGAAVVARALDRLYRRMVAGAGVLPRPEPLLRSGMQVMSAVAERRCQQSLTLLTAHLRQAISGARQALLTLPVASAPGQQPASLLAEQLATVIGSLAEKMRAEVSALQAFIQPELSFGVTAAFRRQFCRQHVRETLVVGYFRHLGTTCRRFCEPTAAGGGAEKASPGVLLLLSRVCRDLETSTVHYLLNYVDDLLRIEDKAGLTPLSDITDEMRDVGQLLINHYVRVQGLSVSQMLRQSVVSRDWQLAHEPRGVRSVMKRVLEELAVVDAQVGALYEEAVGRWEQANSSDSSRRTGQGVGRGLRHDWSSYAPSQVDSGLVANIQKLFSERIEIFAPVEFTKVSILTGIIKISLKTLLECVRLKTFNKFGLQQVQVDVHYLQLNLWRFVADEKLLHGLLDEVLGSAIHRCLQPALMEFSVIEVMCERG